MKIALFASVFFFTFLALLPGAPEPPETAESLEERGVVGVVVPSSEQAPGGDFRVIASVLPQGPAGLAGIRQGDRFVSVDGKATAEMQSTAELVEALRGAPGTTVQIEIKRGDTGKAETFTLTRARHATLLNAGPAGLEALPPDRLLKGSVTDAAAQPVAGARMTLVMQDGLGPQRLLTTETEADGTFAFAGPWKPALGARQPQVFAEAPGLGLAFSVVPAMGGDPGLRLVLAPSLKLQVHVCDETGAPLSGLRLQPESLIGTDASEGTVSHLPPAIAGRLAQVSDQEGNCTFTDLPATGRVRLHVMGDRFAQPKEGEEDAWLGATAAVKLTLLPAATIHGTVTLPDGQPPKLGLRVLVQANTMQLSTTTALTDLRGHFTVPQLRSGAYTVCLDREQPAARDWTAAARAEVFVATGEQLGGVDLALTPGGFIQGRVRDKTGQPMPRAPVGIFGPARPASSMHAETIFADAEGIYRVRVPAGEQHIAPVNFQIVRPGGALTNEKVLQVRAGETVTQDLESAVPVRRLANVQPILVRVVDSEGKSVPGTKVLAHLKSADARTDRWILVGNGSGTISFSAPGETKVVEVKARGGDLATRFPSPVQEGDQVTLEVEPGVTGRLTGRAVDPAGQPIAGAVVWLRQWTAPGTTEQEVGATGLDGTFEVRDIWPRETYSVRVGAKGWTREESPKATLELGETRELVPLLLQPATAELAGRVVNQRGAPIPGYSLAVSNPHMMQQSTITDRAGRFRFTGVLLEELELRSWEPNPAGQLQARSKGGETKLEVVVQPGAGEEK